MDVPDWKLRGQLGCGVLFLGMSLVRGIWECDQLLHHTSLLLLRPNPLLGIICAPSILPIPAVIPVCNCHAYWSHLFFISSHISLFLCYSWHLMTYCLGNPFDCHTVLLFNFSYIVLCFLEGREPNSSDANLAIDKGGNEVRGNENCTKSCEQLPTGLVGSCELELLSFSWTLVSAWKSEAWLTVGHAATWKCVSERMNTSVTLSYIQMKWSPCLENSI